MIDLSLRNLRKKLGFGVKEAGATQITNTNLKQFIIKHFSLYEYSFPEVHQTVPGHIYDPCH